MIHSFAKRVIIALDCKTLAEAQSFATRLAPFGVKFKIGMELFYAAGPDAVSKIARYGDVFLDLKLHDIPRTMARAAAVLADLGVWLFNVHASAGREALECVRDTLESRGKKRPLVIGVTVLTSLADLNHLGAPLAAKDAAVSLAKLSHDAGLDGVVCSPRDVTAIKNLGKNFLCVTPGIRGLTDESGDQKRTATAGEAIVLGSDYLVVGRPVIQAADPELALENLLSEVSAATGAAPAGQK